MLKVIAATVASDPEKYSEAFLGKRNADYCNWILDSEKWGGAIELSILADYYGREIAAYDIQTTRCDLYGQVSHLYAFYMAYYMLPSFGISYD
ncbi:ubiquitin thioesterase OTU1-like [Cajanus cajan]|uniref:ubiquitin thioesterase OTU1-like n=1 Tax=Cajanus cajan TaxID=3821 RepID=UPI0010FB175F|nr:ubiquitin thioesterase OTU1-like [Cajanus cajan]